MAINIHHTYCTHVDIIYYTKDGYTLRCNDCGQMDVIAEQVCEILVECNFSYAEVYSAETSEVLMVIEKT